MTGQIGEKGTGHISYEIQDSQSLKDRTEQPMQRSCDGQTVNNKNTKGQPVILSLNRLASVGKQGQKSHVEERQNGQTEKGCRQVKQNNFKKHRKVSAGKPRQNSHM